MQVRPVRRWIRPAALLLGLCLYPGAARAADAIKLTSGLIIEGDITVENERVVKVRVTTGSLMQFPRAAIASIEYGPDSNAPSQVQQREEASKADLKEAQKKVKAIKIRKRKRRKKKKEKKKEEQAAVQQGVMADGTLIVPLQSTPEEDKWIKELRTGKNKIGACRKLAELNSIIAIPDLINALDNEGVIVRREANTALTKITHQDFRFPFDHRNRSTRVAIIKKWRKWYEQASGKKVPWTRM